MRKTLTLWLCVLIFGATVAAVQQAGDADRTGTWTGTWEGGGGTGGFELTLEKPSAGPLTGRVSVTGEPTYKATLKTVSIEGNKLTAAYDFPPADGAEVLITGEFEGNSCKANWRLREKSTGNVAVEGTLSLAKK